MYFFLSSLFETRNRNDFYIILLKRIDILPRNAQNPVISPQDLMQARKIWQIRKIRRSGSTICAQSVE